MPRPLGTSQQYLPGLDGLRAIAVLGAIWYHTNAASLPGGLLGVGVFFTLSGFLITSLLLKEWQTKGKVSLGHFWIRRIRRLLPAVIILVAVVWAATAIAQPDLLRERGWQGVAAIFYVNNWYEIAQGNSYFDAFAGHGPLDHMWSLSVEEQFYFIWPLIFVGLGIIARGNTKKMRIFGASFAIIATALSTWLMISLYTPGLDNSRIYQGTDTRAAGLFWGVALAFCWRLGGTLRPGIARGVVELLGLGGLIGILVMMVTTNDAEPFLYHQGFPLLSLATLGVLIAVSSQHTWMSKILGCTPLRWVGERTYGIYLWHMPILAFMPQSWVQEHPLLVGLGTIALTIVIAAFSWRFIEDPIRRHGIRAVGRSVMRNLNGDQIRKNFATRLPVGIHIAAISVFSVASLVALNAAVPEGSRQAEDLDTLARAQAQQDAGADNPQTATGQVVDPASDGLANCTTVIHIGDSTSIALDSEAYIVDPEQRLTAQYYRVGASVVVNDTKGARATFERLGSDPNIQEVITNLLAQNYEDPCWVLAVGTNDAANIQVGNSGPPSSRIDTIMELLKDQEKVMWGTLRTVNATDPAYIDTTMQSYSDAIIESCQQYPNLRVYDWRNEVHDDWFIDDGIHPNSEGAIAKAHRFADALAQAYPRGKKPHPGCVVTSGDQSEPETEPGTKISESPDAQELIPAV
ncbi:MAG: acyltransferase family protein [Corynebacterium sp.]|nr:acyltransferase family protein [Corynebacterium sp.]